MLRPIIEGDVTALAALYLRAYDEPGTTLEAAATEMESAFDGTWGELWREASPVARLDGDVVGVVQTVRRPAMDDALGVPWLIEVFTDPGQRRGGLARALVGIAGRALAAAGENRVGLTVDDANLPALTLYRSLGFEPTR